jgi:UDP-2,4-diacetamido-2,4,6-trideoxy-beta-L-altropyranose hydrolase
MRVAIRTDASSDIGTGHVMRCLALAEELKDKTAEVLFICREMPGHLADYIKEKGFLVSLLQSSENREILITDIGALPHANWLGTTWEQDTQETYQILNKKPFWDWLIVDHYALDVRWDKSQRSFVNNIMVIDDLADRQHDCDILLDQNLYEGMELRYQELVPGTCKQLIGPKYALLRREFRKTRLRRRERDGSVARFSRSQDLPPLYCPSGAIWVARAPVLKAAKSFYATGHTYYPLSWMSAMDIDDVEDLELAKACFVVKQHQKSGRS